MIEIVEVVRRETAVVERPGGSEKVVVELPPVLQVVEVAMQGPPGRPGDPGPAGVSSMAFVATAPLGGHRVLTLNSVGDLTYASNDVPADAGRIVGMSLNAAALGGVISVQRSGEVSEPTWNWDVTQPIYLGVNGLLTQLPPTSPAVFSLIVGFPMTPTSLFVSIREPITLS